MGLSQRALGLRFDPPVTTQFISNVERGVTPLPPAHVPTLTQALGIPETELMALLEREFTMKLSGRLGKPEDAMHDGLGSLPTPESLPIDRTDYEFMRSLYESFRRADDKTRQAFVDVCANLLKVASHP